MQDVVIVGAGPAGAALAIGLGRRGRTVTLVDRARFPRDKTCGECLVPGALPLLADLGVLPAIAAVAAPMRGLRLVASDGAMVEVPYPGGRPGLSLPRVDLDALLLDAARATPGVAVLEGAALDDLLRDGDGAIAGIRVAGGVEHPARVVVGADGRFSRVRRLAFGPDVAAKTDRYCFLNTWHGVTGSDDMLECGLVGPTLQYLRVDQGPGRLSVCLVVDTATRDAHAAGTADGYMALARRQPRLAERLATATLAGPMKGMPMVPYGAERLVADGLLLVGDAVGFMDPITGEGMCRALHAAALAAEHLHVALGAPGPVRGAALAGYERALRAHHAPMLRFVNLAVRATTAPAWASPAAVAALTACPPLARAIAAAQGALMPPDALYWPPLWPSG